MLSLELQCHREACVSCPHWSHLQLYVLAQGHQARAKCPLRIMLIHFLEINPRDGKSHSIFLGTVIHFAHLGLFSLGASLGTKPHCIPEMPWLGCRESEELALRGGRTFVFFCVLQSELLIKIKSLASWVS